MPIVYISIYIIDRLITISPAAHTIACALGALGVNQYFEFTQNKYWINVSHGSY